MSYVQELARVDAELALIAGTTGDLLLMTLWELDWLAERVLIEREMSNIIVRKCLDREGNSRTLNRAGHADVEASNAPLAGPTGKGQSMRKTYSATETPVSPKEKPYTFDSVLEAVDRAHEIVLLRELETEAE